MLLSFNQQTKAKEDISPFSYLYVVESRALFVRRQFFSMFLIRCQHNVNLGIKSQTPNVERKHFNALYKPVFCFAKQCNGSNKVSLFYLLV